MTWNTTSWHFVTSRGFEFTFGNAWQLGLAAGSFFLENTYTRREIELKCGALARHSRSQSAKSSGNPRSVLK